MLDINKIVKNISRNTLINISRNKRKELKTKNNDRYNIQILMKWLQIQIDLNYSD